MVVSADRQLWDAFVRQRDDASRSAIVRRYLPLVRYVAARMAVSPPPGLDFEDILSFGAIGLLDAIERFDLERGFSFQTFAVPRIRGAILDELRKYDWISRTGREKLQRLDKAIEKLTHERHKLDDHALQKELGMDESSYRELLEVASRSYVTSLDESVAMDDSEIERTEMVVDEAPLADEVYERNEEISRVLGALQQLAEREQLLLSLYYGDGLTLREIGAVLGITESRVSQIHGKALATLRGLLAEPHI